MMRVWVTYETADGFKKERVPGGVWTDDYAYVEKNSPRWQWEERIMVELPPGVVLQRLNKGE
jgi:hypothetical protein